MNLCLVPDTPFGPAAILWTARAARPVVERILLPRPGRTGARRLRRLSPGARVHSCAEMDALARALSSLLAGNPVRFSLGLLALDALPPFQQAVLRATARIPRGRVRSYGALAAQLGWPRAARAVGTALARNPFPLVVPCHRVIRADGRLGGFGGGAALKLALLAREGVAFDPARRRRA